MKKSVSKFIEEIKTALSPKTTNAQQEAWWILQELTKKSDAELITCDHLELTKGQEEILALWIKERVQEDKPLQYIFGHIPFCNLDVLVKEPILIPRPETEEWTNWLIEKIKKLDQDAQKIKILDMCTGSGCIALALGQELPNAQITGADINPKAIELSNGNKVHNKINNVNFIKSNLYKNIKEDKFDIIVSNPPYISKKDWQDLNPTVRNWEDERALVAKDNGYLALEEIIKGAKDYLIENEQLKALRIPQIVLEFGQSQENKIKTILESHNFKNIEIWQDLNSIHRWASATL